jgi:hypothetical protein
MRYTVRAFVRSSFYSITRDELHEVLSVFEMDREIFQQAINHAERLFSMATVGGRAKGGRHSTFARMASNANLLGSGGSGGEGSAFPVRRGRTSLPTCLAAGKPATHVNSISRGGTSAAAAAALADARAVEAALAERSTLTACNTGTSTPSDSFSGKGGNSSSTQLRYSTRHDAVSGGANDRAISELQATVLRDGKRINQIASDVSLIASSLEAQKAMTAQLLRHMGVADAPAEERAKDRFAERKISFKDSPGGGTAQSEGDSSSGKSKLGGVLSFLDA